MGLAELRAAVLDANLAAHGSEVTVTVPGSDPVEVTGIWSSVETEEVPAGMDFRRREGRWALVIRKGDLDRFPRESVVDGAPPGMSSRRWMVDGTTKVEGDRMYVALKPAG